MAILEASDLLRAGDLGPVLQAALDAMTAHVAILDHEGVIVAVNAAWSHYGEANGHRAAGQGLGCRYVDMCRPAVESQDKDAIAAAQAIAKLLSSPPPARIAFDYLCPHPADPTRDRWFHLTLQSFALQGKTHIMMSHEDITERYVTARNQALLIEALDQILAGVLITDAQGDILYANPGFSAMTGYALQEVIGRNPRFLRSGRTTAADYGALWATISSGKTWRGTLHNLRKNGEHYWASQTISPLVDPAGVITHYVAVQEDITESQRNARLHAGLVSSTMDAFVSIDIEGRICDWGGRAEVMFGYPHDAVAGQCFAEIACDPEAAYTLTTQLADFRAGQPNRFGKAQRLTMRHANGEPFPAEMNLVPVDLDGQWRFTGFVRDLTETVLAEQQLLQAQKMEAVGQLAGSMAHDFNNILGIISGSLDLIQMELGENHKYVSIAKEATTRATQSVASLMSVARKRAVNPTWVDVNKTLEELMPLLKQTAGRQIDLKLCAAPDLPPIYVEPTGLYNAIVNLVVNARDAMAAGRGQMIVYAYVIQIDPSLSLPGLDLPPGQYLLVGVDDTGPGMTPEVAEKAFEPFFTTKGEGVGTGLGLPMVYQFSRRSGGLARINSQEGQGCSVQMLFPVNHARASQAAAEPQRQGSKKILVVDPDPIFLASTSTRLKGVGYAPITASTSALATRLLAQHDIDVLMVDLGMRNCEDLVDVVQGLRSDQRAIGLAFSSAAPSPARHKSAPQAPVVRKPIIHPETLVQCIEQAYQGRNLS